MEAVGEENFQTVLLFIYIRKKKYFYSCVMNQSIFLNFKYTVC